MPAPLVTGGRGFAGQHLVEALREAGHEPASPSREELDLRDPDAVRRAVAAARPSAVFHLGALASVGRSWADPAEVLRANVDMTVNLLEAVREECPEVPVLIAGSGEVYGPPGRLPVEETAPLRPQSPYAVSKAACDLLGGQYSDAHGMRVVRTRAFNHAGPGQSDTYVIGTLARQVAEAEREGRSEIVLSLGNVDAARDFTDVRDVVRAYTGAIEADSGAYNVCSGRARKVRELVELLGEAADLDVSYEVDPARLRPHEVLEVRGSAERLAVATGWRPEISVERTIADALQSWRERLG